MYFWNKFFDKENLNVKKNYTKSEQSHAKCPVFTQNFNPRQPLEKKTKLKKILKLWILRWKSFLMILLTYLYDEYIYIYIYIYRSAKIVWTKNNHLSI